MYLRKQGPGRRSPPPTSPRRRRHRAQPDLKLATLSRRASSRSSWSSSAAAATSPLAEQGRRPPRSDGITVDSIYSPVLKVTYRVRGHPRRAAAAYDFDSWCWTSRPSRRSPRGTRWPRPVPPWSSCSAGPRAQRRARKASRSGRRPPRRGRPHRRVRAADRGDGPDRPILQLPQARGHPHRRRNGLPGPRPTCWTSATSGRSRSTRFKIKLAGMGLALKDSPAGFDPAAAAMSYGDSDWNDDTDDSGYGSLAVSAPGPGTTPTTRRPSKSRCLRQGDGHAFGRARSPLGVGVAALRPTERLRRFGGVRLRRPVIRAQQ